MWAWVHVSVRERYHGKGSCRNFFLFPLLVKPQTFKRAQKSERGHRDHWAAPVGKTSVRWVDSFSYITENLGPATSPPRLQKSSKCINIKWNLLPPIEPSVLPVLSMSFTFSMLYLDHLSVFIWWCSIAFCFPENNYQILFPIFK